VRDSLEAYGGMQIISLSCSGGSRCEATFAVGGQTLGMRYGIAALESAPRCWEVTAFEVTQPVPELGGFAAPLPNRGCVHE
jgi:hypothetical protein